MIKEVSVFNFRDYKAYLLARVGSKQQRLGIKSKLASALQVQPGFVSQVIHGNQNLSLEQAENLNQFFGHTSTEAHFFLLLLQMEKAGTFSLKKYFQQQIEEILKKRMNVVERLGNSLQLSTADQNIYYSSWHYASIHIAITIPELQTTAALSDFFRVPLKKVNVVVDFLKTAGLVKLEKGRLLPGETQVRLGNDSVNIIRHHTNFRQMAIDSLDREEIGDLHYSAALSISEEDIEKIKEIFLKAIDANQSIVRPSKEECLYGLNIDFFNMKRS